MYSGQIRGGSSRVKRAALTRKGVCLVRIQTTEDVELIAERGQRTERGSQLESDAFLRRRPLAHVDPVGNVEESHAHRSLDGAERRNHPVQKRQRKSRSHSTQERAARNGFLKNRHSSLVLLI